MTQQRPPHDQLVFVNRTLRTSVTNLKAQLKAANLALAAMSESLAELISYCRDRADNETSSYTESAAYDDVTSRLTRIVDGEQ